MRRLSIALLLAVLVLSLCACRGTSVFDGSMTGNEDRFELDFSVLNTAYEHKLQMDAGEGIDVLVEKSAGKLSLSIGREDGSFAYRGDDVSSGSFTVIADEGGEYILRVSGSGAKGHVLFSRQSRTD